MPKKNPPVLKSVAIHQLRTLAIELKKTPTAKDIALGAKEKKCPPLSTISELFGGVTGAIREASLPPQRNQEFTKAQLIAQLRDLSKALGRPITRRDVKRAGKAGTCARLATFARVFGTPGVAFRQAGVMRTDRFTRDELVAQYARLYKEIGKVPSYRDIQRAAKAGKCAGYKLFRRRCGTLEQLRRAAALPDRPREKYSRQALLEQLRVLARRLGRPPLAKELIAAGRRGECADMQTFTRRFGGYNKGLSAAGLAIRPSAYSRAQMIAMLQALAKKLGHRPTVKEVNEAKRRGECASAPTYDDHFGNLSSALRAAKLDGMPARVAPRKPRKARKLYSRERIMNELRQLATRLDRVPTQADVNAASARRECASASTIKEWFGSLGEALETIGIESRGRVRRPSLLRPFEGTER